MKKGFTLVELLGIIVLLTVISLIAISRVSKIVTNYKINAARNSIIGYVDAVDKQQAFNFNDNKAENNITAGFYQVPFDDVYEISFNGKKPTSGWIEMTPNGSNRYSIVIDGYVITNNGTKINVRKGNKPVKQAYPEYAYSKSTGITRVGYPIDEGYEIGEKWVMKHEGVAAAALETKEECETVKSNFNGINLTCSYEPYVTQKIDYKAVPETSWKNYLRFKLSSDGVIEEIAGCIKYKGDEHCVVPNIDEAGYTKSKKRLSDIFESGNCSEYNGMYKCVGTNSMAFEVCPKGCVGTYHESSYCDIMSSGLAYCIDYGAINN